MHKSERITKDGSRLCVNLDIEKSEETTRKATGVSVGPITFKYTIAF